MRFCIEQEIFSMFPNFCRGVVNKMAAGIDNSRPCPELETLLKEQEEKMRRDPGMDLARRIRELRHGRRRYRRFGSNPNKFTPSIVFLAKQANPKLSVRFISPAVDAFNYISSSM